MDSIGSYKKSPVFKIAAEATAAQAVESFNFHKIGALFVENNSDFIGIVTKRDLMPLTMERRDLSTVKIKDIMVSPIPALDEGKSLADACLFIGERNTRYLGVTQGGKIAGIVSIKDILPAEIYRSAQTTDDLLNKVEDYGRLLKQQARPG